MSYYYGYGAPGTAINGLYMWWQLNTDKTEYSEFCSDLKKIREFYEPSKKVSKDSEKNAIYISNILGFDKFVKYYKK